jgi:hypothetical protein
MGASKIRFTPSKKKGETWLYPEEPAHKMGMETFKRLRDGPQGQPKKNIAAVTLFSLAQNAAKKMVRWVIDQEGKLHAGDGFFLIHMDIVQSWGAQKYKGWIDLEKKYYAVASVDDGVVRNVDPHMVTDKMVQRIVKWAEQKGLRLDREQVFESYMNDIRLYLNEMKAIQKKVHKIAYTQAYDLTKNFEYKQARVIIDKNDNILIGDSYAWNHDQVIAGTEDGLEDDGAFPSLVKYAGVIDIPDGTYAITTVTRGGGYSFKEVKLSGKAEKLAAFLEKKGLKRMPDWEL